MTRDLFGLVHRLVEQHDEYHGDCTNDPTWNEARAIVEQPIEVVKAWAPVTKEWLADHHPEATER